RAAAAGEAAGKGSGSGSGRATGRRTGAGFPARTFTCRPLGAGRGLRLPEFVDLLLALLDLRLADREHREPAVGGELRAGAERLAVHDIALRLPDLEHAVAPLRLDLVGDPHAVAAVGGAAQRLPLVVVVVGQRTFVGARRILGRQRSGNAERNGG